MSFYFVGHVDIRIYISQMNGLMKAERRGRKERNKGS
jgi:hypothetical protein